MDKSLKGRTFMCQFGPDTGEEFEIIQEFIGVDNGTAQVKMQHIGSTRTKYETLTDLMNPVYYTETTPEPAEDEDSNPFCEIEVKWADQGFTTTFRRGVRMDYQDRAILIFDKHDALIDIININKIRNATVRRR